MTSRERMAVAMAKGEPDRPPLMCQLSLGHYFLHTDHDEIDVWHDTETFSRALVELQRRYGFDGILVNLPGRDPSWRDHVRAITGDEDGNRVIHWTDGRVTVAPADDNPHVYTADGEALHVPFDDVDPDTLFYVEPHDVSGVSHPHAWGFSGDPAPAGGPDFFPPWHCDTLRRVRELAGPDVSVHAEIFSPFTQFMELVGYTEGLMALILDQGKVHASLERLASGAACLGGLYAREDVDAVLVSSAFVGGGFISRDHYQAFEAPFMRTVVDGIKAVRPDLPVYVHTCGAIGDRLDLMESTGVDGIDTLDPPPIGTVELADALDALGKRVFIKGNLDPVHTLLQGTPESVRSAALERLRLGAPGGAYILSTACSVPPATPRGNLVALREAVEEFAAHG
ncbi:MAG: uroporphyrinogen decarboxylase family protein [Gemmatimonadota bacterium]|nr:uroporphyrinogen decarboxylase family protein [Gemmatimonadota bacterium]